MPAPEKKPKFALRPLRAGLLVALLAAALTLTAAAFWFDGPARQAIVATQGKGWKKSEAYRLQGAVSRYGDWPILMLAAGAGLVVAWRRGRRDWQRILVTAMVASTLAGMVVNVARLTTGRTRPRESPKIEQGWYGPYHHGKFTIGNSKYNSFPSGHTATAFGLAGVLFLARPLLGALAMFAALGIAWSRLLLGAHHLSDVTVGALVALFIAWICWEIAQRRGDEIATAIRGKFRRAT